MLISGNLAGRQAATKSHCAMACNAMHNKGHTKEGHVRDWLPVLRPVEQKDMGAQL